MINFCTINRINYTVDAICRYFSVVRGDDATGDASASVAGLEALSVFAAAQVVGLGVHHEGASQNGILGAGGQRNALSGKVHGGHSGDVRLDVAEISGVTTLVIGRSVGALMGKKTFE